MTVAGGNGSGNGANQLSSPQSAYISRKAGATQGVTVAGDSEVPDIMGMSPYNGPNQLYKPIGVVPDPNETLSLRRRSNK